MRRKADAGFFTVATGRPYVWGMRSGPKKQGKMYRKGGGGIRTKRAVLVSQVVKASEREKRGTKQSDRRNNSRRKFR